MMLAFRGCSPVGWLPTKKRMSPALNPIPENIWRGIDQQRKIAPPREVLRFATQPLVVSTKPDEIESVEVTLHISNPHRWTACCSLRTSDRVIDLAAYE
jgi:hypothetical protein